MRITAKIRRGLAGLAAHCDAGSTGEDLLGLPDDWQDRLQGAELAEAERKVAEMEEALEYLWHLANGGRKPG